MTNLNSEDTESRIVLDYTSRDFPAIRTQLVGLAKGFMPEWETAGENGDFGTLLLELFAYMGDVMHFYIDRAASEAFLGTALRQTSVLYIADMLGYKPVGQHSASVKLVFSIDDPNATESTTITLPRGTRVHNEADNADDVIVFELDSEVKLDPLGPAYVDPPAAGTVYSSGVPVYATEGYMVTDRLLGISRGAPTTELLIPEKGVVSNTVIVNTREAGLIIPWTEITDISLARPTQSAFATFIDDENQTHIIFGDNAAGRIPPVDAEIFADYRVGVGARANNLGTDVLKVITAPADLSDQIWAISVTNPEVPVGGTDVESIDSMRYSVPRSSRIKNRAITLTDYADLALQVPGVAKSTAYGSTYSSVHVRIAPVRGVGDTSYMGILIDQVDAYMADKILTGSVIKVEPTDLNDLWQDVFIRMTVNVQPAYNRSDVRDAVEKVLRETLAFDQVDFGTRVSIGLIYRTALAVNGVEWVDLEHLAGVAPVDETDLTTTPVIEEVNAPETYVESAIMIPRIEDTEVTEDETDFPTLDEDERTHDGLWVKAVGGLVNT